MAGAATAARSIVDIANPMHPKQVEFIPASGRRITTGRARMSIWVDAASSRETCWRSTTRPSARMCRATRAPAQGGGFDLYDVTIPPIPSRWCRVRRPVAAGKGCTKKSQNPAAIPKSYHSVFVWQRRSARGVPRGSRQHEVGRPMSTSSTSRTRENPEFINKKDLDQNLRPAESQREIVEPWRPTATRPSTTTSS